MVTSTQIFVRASLMEDFSSGILKTYNIYIYVCIFRILELELFIENALSFLIQKYIGTYIIIKYILIE